MNVSQEDARDALKDVDTVAEATRTVAAYSGVDLILLVWGIVWFLGSLASYALTHPSICQLVWLGPVWDLLGIIGILLTILICRRSPIQNPAGRRIGIFWGALYAYTYVGIAVLWPYLKLEPLMGVEGSKAITALATIIPMFAYVVMGLWLENKYLAWFGVTITALICLGYSAFPALFYLWLAFVCGGAFIGSGAYMRVQCRRARRLIAQDQSCHA